MSEVLAWIVLGVLQCIAFWATYKLGVLHGRVVKPDKDGTYTVYLYNKDGAVTRMAENWSMK